MNAEGSVVAVIVTTDRPDELAKTLQRVVAQTRPPDAVLVVDTGNNPRTLAAVAAFPAAEHVHSKVNLGGAGGFAFGMMLALTRGADWVWVMDDDGRPEDDGCLQTLLATIIAQQLDAGAPLVIDPDDHRRLSFPHRFGGRYNYERDKIEQLGLIRDFTHLFNGALFRRSVFYRAGVPDMRLFIRGDEVEFMHRMLRAGIKLATITSTAFVHPSGWSETVPLVKGFFHAVVPNSDYKKYCFFRNRGYIFWRYNLYAHFAYDLLRYSIYFLIVNKGDWRGLKLFLSAMRDGMRSRFDYPLK
jgi:rhamnopyranosyl-N-acetylglucosaminyl-diphospho-decaprenol beta-1,3/1,4-galactofuranosyltransferase